MRAPLRQASAMALRRVPAVNSSWLDDAIRTYNYVDVSVAGARTAVNSTLRVTAFCTCQLWLCVCHGQFDPPRVTCRDTPDLVSPRVACAMSI